MHWYFLIFSYKLTVSNGLSLTTLNSEEITLCSGSFKWVLIDGMDMHRVRSFSLAVLHGGGHHLSLSRQMTVSNGFSLTVWKHVAVTFLSSSFKWGEGRGGGGHWPK